VCTTSKHQVYNNHLSSLQAQSVNYKNCSRTWSLMTSWNPQPPFHTMSMNTQRHTQVSA